MARLNVSFCLLATILGVAFAISHSKDGQSLGTLTDEELRMGDQVGYSYVDKLAQLEEDLLAQGVYVKRDSHLFRMSQFKQPSEKALQLAHQSMQMIETTRFLMNELGLSREELSASVMKGGGLSLVNNSRIIPPTCASSCKYRMIDGSCNNKLITNLGQASTVFRRLLTPDYYDGIQSARNTSTNGSALPSARLISTTVFHGADIPLTNVTSLLMQFGQFINHDMEATNQFSFANGTGITCCSATNGDLDASQLNPACLPISVPTDDPFVNSVNVTQTCMNFVRSITGPRLNYSLALGYADQLNSNTHWLDASMVYGSDNDTMQSLRSFSDGQLKMSTDSSGRELLPVSSSCTTGTCFMAGDSRVTEQPQLTVMHTLWAREHNRIAAKLSALNPKWSDETIFQETRRIVIAEIQHIIYNEFLPNLLSSVTIAQYGLAPLTKGFVTNYTSSYTSGPISNEFATAAFRVGHSLIQGTVRLYDENGTMVTSYSMSDVFNNPSFVLNDTSYIDNVIRGLATQPSLAADIFVTNAMWLSLFREPPARFGFDIVALNLQRGRDHGLPNYNKYRAYCGLSNLTQFSDLTPTDTTNPLIPVFSNATAAAISSNYATVDDIDLFTGLLGENPLSSGGIVGPTAACLLGENFHKIKYGDRFFYENGNQPHSFTSAQLAEIRKVSMARIFCDNNDGSVLSMQPQAFVVANSGTNAKVLCTNTTSIPSMNLNLWQGENLF